jgi:hypothetical protein
VYLHIETLSKIILERLPACPWLQAGLPGGNEGRRHVPMLRRGSEQPISAEEEAEQQNAAIQALIQEARSKFPGGHITAASDYYTVHVPLTPARASLGQGLLRSSSLAAPRHSTAGAQQRPTQRPASFEASQWQ